MIEKKTWHKHAKQSGLLSEVPEKSSGKSSLTNAEKMIDKELKSIT